MMVHSQLPQHLTTFATRFSLVVTAFCIHLCAAAQVDIGNRETYITWDDFMAEYTGDEEAGIDDETIDLLERIHSSPININTASRQQLLSLPFISAEQADSLLSYRNKKRMFRSLGELMFFKNLDYNDRRYLSLFVYAGDTLRNGQKLSLSHFLDGKHEVETRLDIPLYRRAGYKTYSKEELVDNPNKIYLGNALSNVVRYRYNYGRRLTYGLTLQKDAGEPFANRNSYPYSYSSAYFHYRPLSGEYAIWIGDYDLGLSEGLLFSNSFYMGKTQIGESFGKSGLRIRPHTSTDEWRFFRGAAFSYYMKNWNFSAFASYRNIGGTIKNDTITSLKTDGLYRTLSEINRKNNTSTFLGGAYSSYPGGNWQVGVGGYFSSFSHTVWSSPRAYNRYYFRGRTAAGLSADYLIDLRKWKIQGEMALDKGLHYAMVHKLKYVARSWLNLFLQTRAFSPRFVSIWGKTLQANSRVQNEYGALVGGKANVWSNCELLAYVDFFRLPKASYRAYAPSQGMETFLQATKGLRRGWSLMARYSMKTREQNISGHSGFLEYVSTHKLRFSASSSTDRLSLSAALDATIATKQTAKAEFGGMVSMRAKAKISERLDLHAFYSLFLTDGYSSRLYAYEPQLLYAGSFPSFYDRGTRVVLQARWEIIDGLFLAGRYGFLKYFNRQSISSGLQKIDSSMKNDLSLQLIWRFGGRKWN